MSAPDQQLIDIGLRLALIGMGTVFIGLLILSVSLPLVKKIAEGKKARLVAAGSEVTPAELTKHEVAAITTAIHAHLLRINKLEDMKLTWEMYEKPYSPWRMAGRSKMLIDRTSFRQRSR